MRQRTRLLSNQLIKFELLTQSIRQRKLPVRHLTSCPWLLVRRPEKGLLPADGQKVLCFRSSRNCTPAITIRLIRPKTLVLYRKRAQIASAFDGNSENNPHGRAKGPSRIFRSGPFIEGLKRADDDSVGLDGIGQIPVSVFAAYEEASCALRPDLHLHCPHAPFFRIHIRL